MSGDGEVGVGAVPFFIQAAPPFWLAVWLGFQLCGAGGHYLNSAKDSPHGPSNTTCMRQVVQKKRKKNEKKPKESEKDKDLN